MHIKLENINILILCCYYKIEIHYFQSPNFIDLALNKTQNTKQREGIEIFKRDSLFNEKPMIKRTWGAAWEGWPMEATAEADLVCEGLWSVKWRLSERESGKFESEKCGVCKVGFSNFCFIV